MLWQIAGYTALGLLAAFAAARLFPSRLPAAGLLLLTGVVAALTGGLVGYTIFGGARPELTFAASFATAAAGLSVLASPARRGRHAKITTPGA
ncbi:hypothetical protein [Actinacidiphila epipremni]|jgi:hypothetical protein|uniref:GlsB/YeaQ/YmgE family stress response membrane protein n=1 Tax=Actinacidiphila epipremni TaxID=2053013 RepID=A0ABX0ZHC0_9ACTN|nr:hypothetical protein [Actinacidiphila epipremni]NJP42435.1 hypothetical protein [Actinacidiphila epipremni]